MIKTLTECNHVPTKGAVVLLWTQGTHTLPSSPLILKNEMMMKMKASSQLELSTSMTPTMCFA